VSSNNMCIFEHLFCLFVDLVLRSISNLGGALKLYKPNIWCMHVDKSPWMQISFLILCSFESNYNNFSNSCWKCFMEVIIYKSSLLLSKGSYVLYRFNIWTNVM
jgi:hypothetical protein